LLSRVQAHYQHAGSDVAASVSAHPAPQLPPHHARISEKPRLEFLEELRRLNGTPTEVLGNAELVDLILPALRADFKAIELYRYIKERPLACQIVAYGGAGDEEVLETELLAWREQTASRFSHRMFAGGHFYLRTVADEFVARLRVGFAEFMHSALPLKGDPPLRAPFSVP
jgi:surfactin synthase thioesterase subunit